MQPRSLRLIHASLIKFGSCHDLTRPSWHGMLLPSGLGKQCLKAPLLLRPGNFVRSPFHTLCHATVPPSAPSSHLTTVSRARTCVSSKPGKPAEKPSQLRPLGILRPDAKRLAGTAKELLEPITLPYMRPLPQFAYLPGRGLSDAQSRVVQHLREVRELCRTASPSRVELQRGQGPADLVGGITFALSQAFDTVSRSEILSLLDELGAEPTLRQLIHALHHRSKYRLHSQGAHRHVETTIGIKQGCKLAPTLFSVLTGRLLHALTGRDTVQRFFTGKADDFTMHRTIRSRADLADAHKLILRLLEAVQALKLKVNQAKCAMLVKLCGREAQGVLQKHTCWIPDTAGVLQRHWRLGQHKSWPAYRWEAQIKYLGIQISCGSFDNRHCATPWRRQQRSSNRSGDSFTIADMRGHGPGYSHRLTGGRPHGGNGTLASRLVRPQAPLRPQPASSCEPHTHC